MSIVGLFVTSVCPQRRHVRAGLHRASHHFRDSVQEARGRGDRDALLRRAADDLWSGALRRCQMVVFPQVGRGRRRLRRQFSRDSFPKLPSNLCCSGYDFGYLIKILSNANLPEEEADFFEVLRLYFPVIYDVKYLMKSCKSLKVSQFVDLTRPFVPSHLEAVAAAGNCCLVCRAGCRKWQSSWSWRGSDRSIKPAQTLYSQAWRSSR